MSNQNDFPDWALGPFIRPSEGNPVIDPDPESTFNCPMRNAPVRWEALHTFNPAAIVKDNRIHVLNRAEDDSGEMQMGHHTSRIGDATSADGVTFDRAPTPVLFPAPDAQQKFEWHGGCEDPRCVESETGEFAMTYTQWNNVVPRLAIATSKDLVTWTKHGHMLSRLDVPWNWRTKSGSILTRLADDGRLIAANVHGKYWMYWGEHALHAASSPDLFHWNRGPIVMRPREGYFDSQLTEAGPPALLTDRGIVVLYNGKNHATRGDSRVSKNVYAGGQALFDKEHPTKLIARLDVPYFKPETEYEVTGQYEAGTTFTEGLVHFHDKWFLYYGCADTFIGVAIWTP
ncbi:MAG TPA: glycoside hydrolase family 130 protein [Candidatus Lokiarchaeia archaeon]|nr:glycoside hydrolase family 130 protein [Candidatus Lokiarchaeia archaeon]